MVTAHTRLLHKQRGSMSETPKLDEVSFPGGYEIIDIIVAVKLAEITHVENAPLGDVEHAIVQRFLVEPAGRHLGEGAFQRFRRSI